MGSTYTITTSDDEDNAIAHTAGDPNVDKQEYLEACVHGQLLQPWVKNYWIATSPVPPVDVATGYVTATPEQQQQINDILGLTPTPPPNGGTTPPEPTVVTYNYVWQRTTPPPSSGQVRTAPGGTDWTTPTQLGLSQQTADSQDATATLGQIVAGTTFHIADTAGNTLDMTASDVGADGGSASTVMPVSATGNTGSTPANGTAVTVTITIPAPVVRAVPAGPERALTF